MEVWEREREEGMLWKWRGKRVTFEKGRDRKRGDEVWERDRGREGIEF